MRIELVPFHHTFRKSYKLYLAEVLQVEVTDLIETENKPMVSGFVKVNGEVIELSSIADLEQAMSCIK